MVAKKLNLRDGVEKLLRMKRAEDPVNTTIYVSKAILNEFRKACQLERHSSNEVIEVLMRMFIDDLTN